jgi:hypothetical protein
MDQKRSRKFSTERRQRLSEKENKIQHQKEQLWLAARSLGFITAHSHPTTNDKKGAAEWR